MQGLLVDGALHGIVISMSSTCQLQESVVVFFYVNTSCSVVWKDIGKWDNYNWVHGCEHVQRL